MSLTDAQRDAIFEKYQARLIARGANEHEAREAAVVAFEGGDTGMIAEDGEWVPDWPPWLAYETYDAWEIRVDELVAQGVLMPDAEEAAAEELNGPHRPRC